MTPYISSAPEASAQLVAATYTGRLRTLTVTNHAAATRWLYVYSGTSSSGTLIFGPFPIAASQGVIFDFGETKAGSVPPLIGKFTDGVFAASSTSGSSFSAGGSDFRFNSEAT